MQFHFLILAKAVCRRSKKQASMETLETDYCIMDTNAVAPIDIQPIGSELAIKWEDGTESFVSLEKLRRACPCAGCKGEMDIMGNLYKNPEKPLSPSAFQLKRLDRVGTYAIKPVWADGHESGLFSFDYLKRLTN